MRTALLHLYVCVHKNHANTKTFKSYYKIKNNVNILKLHKCFLKGEFLPKFLSFAIMHNVTIIMIKTLQ